MNKTNKKKNHCKRDNTSSTTQHFMTNVRKVNFSPTHDVEENLMVCLCDLRIACKLKLSVSPTLVKPLICIFVNFAWGHCIYFRTALMLMHICCACVFRYWLQVITIIFMQKKKMNSAAIAMHSVK